MILTTGSLIHLKREIIIKYSGPKKKKFQSNIYAAAEIIAHF